MLFRLLHAPVRDPENEATTQLKREYFILSQSFSLYAAGASS